MNASNSNKAYPGSSWGYSDPFAYPSNLVPSQPQGLGSNTGPSSVGQSYGSHDLSVPSCHASHPALEIIEGVHVWGGSCSQPQIDDADVYVGLDASMAGHWSLLPWHGAEGVLFKITDMTAPSDPAEFQSLIDYVQSRLDNGARVHVGCIGGHGRTGMVLAALVKQMRGEPKATAYVREHYCASAVETQGQIDFLQKHFGIEPVKAAKGASPTKGATRAHIAEINPVKSPLAIWGDTL